MPLIPIKATVKSNTRVTHDVCVTVMTITSPKDLQFKAGQYLFVKASERVLRAYSISSLPATLPDVEFCVERVEGGVASNYIWNLVPGQEVELTGVFGQFTYKADPTIERVVMIGTGTGVAPLKVMIEQALADGETRPLHLLFGEKTKADFYYTDDLKQLSQKYPNFTYDLCSSREEVDGFFYGRVTKALEGMFPLDKKTSFYLCGGQAMLSDVRNLLTIKNVHPKFVYQEKFF